MVSQSSGMLSEPGLGAGAGAALAPLEGASPMCRDAGKISLGPPTALGALASSTFCAASGSVPGAGSSAYRTACLSHPALVRSYPDTSVSYTILCTDQRSSSGLSAGSIPRLDRSGPVEDNRATMSSRFQVQSPGPPVGPLSNGLSEICTLASSMTSI